MAKLSVLYASQTGNAEHIAKHFAAEAAKLGVETLCLAMEEHEKVRFSGTATALTLQQADIQGSSLVVFITSTTGDGDPPDNATKV